MTLDRLAANMQRELLGIGRKYDRLDDGVARVEQRMVGLDQKIDRVRVKIVDDVRRKNLKVIESNDRVATKLDRLFEGCQRT